MQHLEVSGAVRLIYRSLGVKGLIVPLTYLVILATGLQSLKMDRDV